MQSELHGGEERIEDVRRLTNPKYSTNDIGSRNTPGKDDMSKDHIANF